MLTPNLDERRRLAETSLISLRPIFVLAIVVAIIVELVSLLLYGESHFLSFISSFADRGTGVIWFLAAFGAEWMILVIAGLWSDRFQKITLYLFGGGLCAAVAASLSGVTDQIDNSTWVLLVAFMLPATLSVTYTLYAVCRYASTRAIPVEAKLFWWMSAFISTMGLLTNSGLRVNVAILPRTFDGLVYRLDDALGPSLAVHFHEFLQAHPLLEICTRLGYILIGYVVILFIGIVLRAGLATPMRLWRLSLWPYLVGWVCYVWLPVSGPIYAFPKQFSGSMPAPSLLQLTSEISAPAFRNGMPSMHLTAALLLFMAAFCVRNRIAMVFSSVFVVVTAWATLPDRSTRCFAIHWCACNPLIAPRKFFKQKSARALSANLRRCVRFLDGFFAFFSRLVRRI